MTNNCNPWDIPEWHSLRREASLVRHLIGSGVTALGRASYADQMGEYYLAFFGLSIGLERLAKLILVADFAINNNGDMPEEKMVVRFGHDLLKLVEQVTKICKKRELRLKYPQPNNEISKRILICLNSFADARRGRYANFSSLGNPNLYNEEPVGKWWNEIAEKILQTHYYDKSIQKRVEANAEVIDEIMSPISLVMFTNEQGQMMQNIKSAAIRTEQSKIVQKFGRYYTLIIARWLSQVLSEMAHTACYHCNITAFHGINEYFYTYIVDDSFLKSRKIWPLQ